MQKKEEITEYLSRIKSETSPRHLFNLEKNLTYLKSLIGKPFKEIKTEDIRQLKNKLSETNTTNSIRVYLATLRRLESVMEYNWHVNWKKLLPKRAPSRSQETLTNEEIERLITTSRTLRNKTLIAVLADTGMRLGEILSLRFKDIRIDGEHILLKIDLPNSRTKDHNRPVPLTWSTKYFKLYIEGVNSNPEAPIFDLTPSAVNKMLAKLAQECKIQKKINPHRFRHTKSTEYSRSGRYSPDTVRNVMGWRTFSQWSTYSHIPPEEAAQIVLKNEKPQTKQVEALLNIERKAIEAAEEKQRLERRIAELEQQTKILNDPRFKEMLLSFGEAIEKAEAKAEKAKQ